MLVNIIKAVILGIVEGITEFLPISSTGHLILTERFIRFEGPLAETFAIFVQLGAILAVVWLYRQPLVQLVKDLPSQARAQRLALNLIIAFIPAGAIGALIHKQIKAYLFNPPVIAGALILGGLVIWWIERRHVPTARQAHRTGPELDFGELSRAVEGSPKSAPPNTHQLQEISPKQAAAIGVAQIFSLVPGVSRSAATILGGMISGLDRRVATEFSFWLAIPTLVLATIFDLATSFDLLQSGDLLILLVGAIVSFFVALVVIRALLRYVQTNTFEPFAYYRIALGLIVLAVAFL